MIGLHCSQCGEILRLPDGFCRSKICAPLLHKGSPLEIEDLKIDHIKIASKGESMTKVVNLLGGSGLGKSTTAALVYGELKMRGYNAELVREYVKEWAWAGKKVGPFGQPIIYGQQLQRESDLYGKVDFIITDSPLILCPIYQQFYAGHDSLKTQVISDLNSAKEMNVDHVNFLLNRTKPFKEDGRYETEEMAKRVDTAVRGFLDYHKLPYTYVDAEDDKKIKFIVDYLLMLDK